MIRTVGVLLAVTLVSSCSGVGGPGETSPTQPPTSPSGASQEEAPPPPLDEDHVALGAELYQQRCASCHRADLSGDPDWKTPNPNGSYPPPPHDSSGHTWHHPDQLLLELIRDGLDIPESRMPPFGDVLSDDEIMAIIEFLKANWGPEERGFQWQVTSDQSQAGD
ncbi:MAG: c-type cytochrome [Acidimicrobiia bacterium]